MKKVNEELIAKYIQVYQTGTELEKTDADDEIMIRIWKRNSDHNQFSRWIFKDGLSAPDIDPAADKLTVKFIGLSALNPNFVECSRENGEIRFETKGPRYNKEYLEKEAALRLCYKRSAEF